MNLQVHSKPDSPHSYSSLSSHEPGVFHDQDRESECETESSKNTTRRRSKRKRRVNLQYLQNKGQNKEIWAIEVEQQVSSMSDTTITEDQDVALCLMMLSRDKWVTNQIKIEAFYESDEEETKSCKIRRNKWKYKCETCDKVFKSYQALGGHRASHKKIKVSSSNPTIFSGLEVEKINAPTLSVNRTKIHECPVCQRVFSSGQALGGHKRSHAQIKNKPVKFGELLVDLNFPAPIDNDEDDGQGEISVVSDGESS